MVRPLDRPSRRIAPVAALGAALICWPTPVAAEVSFYGDIDYFLTARGGAVEHSFAVPSLDLFTSTEVDRFSFLAEILFEVNDANEFVLDVERVQVAYLVNEYLRIRAGRFHTALGMYNDSYHHGTYFMVPVGRPIMVEFEDAGGLIPAHNVGLHADGRIPVGDALHLHYDVELMNGRSPNPDAIQNLRDSNRAKAFNLRLRAEPGGAYDGLIIGGNVYVDSIAPDSGLMIPRMRELIVGGHVGYLEHEYDLIGEIMLVRHDENATGDVHSTLALFGEAGYTFGEFTPYVRYEYTDFADDGDPYFRAAAAEGSFHVLTAGLKHNTSDNVALKVQSSVQLFPDGGDARATIVAQCAFAF